MAQEPSHEQVLAGRRACEQRDRTLICTCPPIEAYDYATSLETQAELV